MAYSTWCSKYYAVAFIGNIHASPPAPRTYYTFCYLSLKVLVARRSSKRNPTRQSQADGDPSRCRQAAYPRLREYVGVIQTMTKFINSTPTIVISRILWTKLQCCLFTTDGKKGPLGNRPFLDEDVNYLGDALMLKKNRYRQGAGTLRYGSLAGNGWKMSISACMRMCQSTLGSGDESCFNF